MARKLKPTTSMKTRNLRPAIFENELLSAADPLWTLLFEGLWCLADREGRLEDRPKIIAARVFPLRRPEPDVRAGLEFLQEAGFIDRYTVDGRDFISIPKFTLHQNPHQREAASAIPPPPQLEAGQETVAANIGSITVKVEGLSQETLGAALAGPRLSLGCAKAALPPTNNHQPTTTTTTTGEAPQTGGGGGGDWRLPEDFLTLWNEAAAANGWVQCERLTPATIEALRARAADPYWSQNFLRALVKAGPIPGLRGQGEKGWRATLDWFLKPDIVQHLCEGVYDTWRRKGPAQVSTAEAARRQEQEARTRDCEECGGDGLVTVPLPSAIVDGVWLRGKTWVVDCRCKGVAAKMDAYERMVPNWRELMRERATTTPT